MSTTQQITGTAVAVSITANTTIYIPFGTASILSTISGTENDQRSFWGNKKAFVSNLFVNVAVNTVTATSTVTLRKNASNTGITVSIGSSATGFFRDLISRDEIRPFDRVNYVVVAGATGTNIQITVISTVTNSGKYYATIFSQTTGSNVGASVTHYMAFTGRNVLTGTEPNAAFRFFGNGILQNLTAYINTNSRSDSTTIRLVKNAANDNQSLSIASSSTGIFEDKINNSNINRTDTACFLTETGAGTGEINTTIINIFYVTLNNQHFVVRGNLTISAATTRYLPICGRGDFSSTELNNVNLMMLKGRNKGSGLFVFVSANTINGATTFTIRNNQSDTALTLSIGNSTTGEFTNSIDQFNFVDDDQLSIAMVAGGTTGSLTKRANSFQGTFAQSNSGSGTLSTPGIF